MPNAAPHAAPSAPLPARQLSDVELAARRAPYEALIGFVPAPASTPTSSGSRKPLGRGTRRASTSRPCS
jgi:hypothetical protein